MLNRAVAVSVLAGALAVLAGPLFAADQVRDQTQDRIYGSQLMTQQERLEYRDRLRSAKTIQEREEIRKQHHERMKVRAKERGVTLPDMPPAGQGSGMRPGGGMGPGGGMRQGGGMRGGN